MPTTRRARTSGGPTTQGGQSTLSFGGRNRVTKSAAAASKLSKDITEKIVRSEDVVVEQPAEKPELGHVFTSDAVVQKQAEEELSKPEVVKSEEVREAERVTETQIRRYWQAREAERRAPRLHQEDLGVEEKVLRYFDMSSQYGPCIGIARMKRWMRANKLGLHPPIEVLAVLLKEEGKGNRKVQRAYVDELLSTQQVVGGE